MPSRDAVSRSIVSRASNPLFCQSLVTSANSGSARISRSTRGAQAVRSFRLSPWIVYWYWALLNFPPTRMSCTGCSPVWAPGTRASFPRIRAITSSAVTFRWSRSFRPMNSRPVLTVLPPPPPPPVKPITVSTAGSFPTMSTTFVSFSRMDWNETSCAARIPPVRRPVSCCGKNPFGTIVYR